jgi:2-methylcitrate dehydratase PrpD
MGLVKDHDLDPSEIAEIRVFVGDYHQIMCDPLDQRRVPSTLVEAKFSLPFLVAVAAVRRDMSLEDFTDESLRNPSVLAAAQKVVPIADPTLDWKLELPAGRVEIVTRDGRRFDRVGTHVPGSAEAPMDWDDVVRKFKDCASFAAVPRSRVQIEGVHSMVQGLESVQDATEILRALS